MAVLLIFDHPRHHCGRGGRRARACERCIRKRSSDQPGIRRCGWSRRHERGRTSVGRRRQASPHAPRRSTSSRSASASGPCSSSSSCSCRSGSSSPTRSTDGKALLVWQGFTHAWYHELFGQRAAAAGDQNSLKSPRSAARSSPSCSARFAGVALARRGGRWAKAFMAIVFLILVTPEIVDAIALPDLVRASRRSVLDGLAFINAARCDSWSATRCSARPS